MPLMRHGECESRETDEHCQAQHLPVANHPITSRMFQNDAHAKSLQDSANVARDCLDPTSPQTPLVTSEMPDAC
jgi:hypothetical protein